MFWGGGEKAHLEYALNFRNAGYKVWVLCSPGSALEEKSKENKLAHFSERIGKISFLNPVKHKIIERFFKENKIDTVFLNASNDIKIGGPAAKSAGVKNIVYMRGLAVPVKNSFLNRYLLCKVITHPVPNSNDTRRTFLTHFRPFLNENNVPIIYRGINFNEWDKRPVRKMSFREKDEIILGNVGRLVTQKGQKYLIELGKILRDRKINFKIIIAGTGPLEHNLKSLIIKNNLDKHVKLIGFQSDIKSFLNGIDIFIFPSLWEGFGNAMVEAMAEKKVPIAFNQTSNPEIIVDGKNGFLVTYPHINAIAEKIEFLIQNPEERQKMEEAARGSVISKFDLQKIIHDWETLLI